MRSMILATMQAGVGQFVALLCGAISVKVLALTVGPAGVGLFSILRHAQQTLSAIASVGGQNAVVQGAALFVGEQRVRFLASALWVVLLANTLVVLGVIVFSEYFGVTVLGERYGHVFRWIAVPTTASVLLIFFRAVLNAHMQIGSVVWVNIIAAVGSVLFVVPASAAYLAGHEEALILVLTGSLGSGALLAIYLVRSKGLLKSFGPVLRHWPDAGLVKHFMGVALPSLAAIFIGLGSLLLVRSLVVRWHGLASAGQFDAAWTISAMYLTLFLSSLQTYLLPALSAGQRGESFNNVVNKTLHLSAIAVVPLITSLVVLKPFAVRLLYSGDFVPALELLRWTLLGDLVKVAGWVLATALVARADMRAYLAREMVWNLVFAGTAAMLLPGGIAGAGPAYVIAYSVYLATLAWRANRKHGISVDGRSVVEWLAGSVIVMVASALTWTDVEVRPVALILIPVALLYSWMVLTKDEQRHARSIPGLLAARFLRR